MISYSQAAQDRFVNELLVIPESLHSGTFLDIGCCHPAKINNTYGLEQLGWRGLLVDNDPGAIRLCRQHRLSAVIEANAVAINWRVELMLRQKASTIDYLSLDIDGHTDDVLAALPLESVKFRVATIEHDAYRCGNNPRERMRARMIEHGYALVCADVCSMDGAPYEDWWVHPSVVPLTRYEHLICEGKKWSDIFP